MKDQNTQKLASRISKVTPAFEQRHKHEIHVYVLSDEMRQANPALTPSENIQAFTKRTYVDNNTTRPF